MKKLKVLLLNGSPRKNGCTNRALTEVATALKNNDIDAEIIWIGAKPIQGCTACGVCRKSNGNGECPYKDGVQEFHQLAKSADGFVFGSPVYYAGANGSLHSFLDRLFFAYGSSLKGKVGACICSARRAGTTATIDNLNKYLLINQMPIASSNYWNAVHGSVPEDVEKDLEGLQTMRMLGNNMAWLLKSIHIANIPFPTEETKIKTNFIR